MSLLIEAPLTPLSSHFPSRVAVFRKGAPPELIRLLLKADFNRESITTTDLSHGRIPLHQALLHRLPLDSLQVLLEYDTDKRSVFVQDYYGRLALEYAWYQYSKDRTATAKSTIELVSQSMLQGRVVQVGLHQWKNEVLHKIIQPLQCRQLKCTRRGDDKGTARFLEESCMAFNSLLEKAILLELVSWKMGGVREYGLMPPALNDRQKSECRITSGADVIVPGVIAFLENEPVISLLASDCLPPVKKMFRCDHDWNLLMLERTNMETFFNRQEGMFFNRQDFFRFDSVMLEEDLRCFDDRLKEIMARTRQAIEPSNNETLFGRPDRVPLQHPVALLLEDRNLRSRRPVRDPCRGPRPRRPRRR